MLFMNDYEVRAAAERYQSHPVLAKATRFLLAYMDEVNGHSDGWAYWRPPLMAARSLMELVGNPQTATDAAFRKALGPIRTFYTRKGYAAGMSFPPIEDGAKINRQLKPDPEDMNEERAAAAGAAIETFIRETRTDRPDALTDLLCDLMHWADREGVTFEDDLERAREHYAAETGEQS